MTKFFFVQAGMHAENCYYETMRVNKLIPFFSALAQLREASEGVKPGDFLSMKVLRKGEELEAERRVGAKHYRFVTAGTHAGLDHPENLHDPKQR